MIFRANGPYLYYFYVYTLLVIYRGRLSVALGLKTKSDNILISEDYIDRYFDLETIFKNFVRATRIFLPVNVLIFVKDSFFLYSSNCFPETFHNRTREAKLLL